MSETIIPSAFPSCDIKVDGIRLSNEALLNSIEVIFSVNRISSARLVFNEGNATDDLSSSVSSLLIPGKKVSISMGYEEKTEEVFEGIIISQNLSVNDQDGATREVSCCDEAIKTTVGRKNATFFQKKDSDIINSILNEYSSIRSNVTATTTEWPQMVQHYATDWDFILSRAEANGLVITVKNSVVSVIIPTAKTDSVLSLSYGDSIIEFNGDLNSVHQLDNVKASSWNYAEQRVISGMSGRSFSGAGNLTTKQLSEVIGLDTYNMQTVGLMNQDELTNWSDAQMIKSELSKFSGEVICQGKSSVYPGDFIRLTGLGNRFDGDHFVSGVTHTFESGKWLTQIEFGLSPKWFTETKDVMSPPASGLLPGARGLFNATVKKNYDDPGNQYRILVDIPLFDSTGEGLWARCGSFYASSDAGAFFLPEVGDEVIIGFLNEDPRYPIILGSLYSDNRHRPPSGLEPNANNSVKAIVSKSGIAVNFDDENQIFTITTPGGNTAIFSDKDEQVTIQDENQNSIVMSPDGIHIKSAKNISVRSEQVLNLVGDQGVSIESSGGDVTIAGMNIKQVADTQFSVDGGEIARINSGAELTLNAGMIMIN